MAKSDPYKHTGSVTKSNTIDLLDKMINELDYQIDINTHKTFKDMNGIWEESIIVCIVAVSKYGKVIRVESPNGLLYGIHTIYRKMQEAGAIE